MPPEIREISGQFADIMVVTELRGAYPNVPIAADVDYAALVAGDPDPSFLTIPIGKANVTSGNKRYYDDAWLQELYRQTLANKPVGIMGHLSEAERGFAFPPEAIHWVGAVIEQDSGILWGKGYIPAGEARDRIRRYKAQGKSIATSIDAHADGVWDESLKAYRMDAKTLRLSQIDIAPADRAGVGVLARVPMLTSEMTDTTSTDVASNEEETKTVDKLTVINEMTAEDARLLPEPVRAAIVATVPTPAEVATVAAIRETLGLDAKADVTAAITELRQAKANAEAKAVSDRITELMTAEEGGIKLEDVRPIVRELVEAKRPATPAAAEAAYKAVVESESVKALLAARVVETMGPPQRTPVQGKRGNKYFQLPSAA
jgi:hypothetical protein